MDSSSSIIDPWEDLYLRLPDFDESCPPAAIALPSPLHDTSVAMQLKSAIARGRQSAKLPSIEGPTLPATATPYQSLVLMEYFQRAQLSSIFHHADAAPSPFGSSSSGPAPAPKSHQPVIQVAPPEPFSGDQAKFGTFVSQLSLKFASDPAAFASDQSRLIYAASYLRGSAYTWVQPHISPLGSLSFSSYEEFLSALRASFDDPDSYATAERQIFALKQDSTCSSYYSRFSSLASILGWTEPAFLVSLFRRGLKDHVKDALVGKAIPQDSLPQFAKACIELDNQFFARSLEKRSSSFFSLPPKPRAPQPLAPRPFQPLPPRAPQPFARPPMAPRAPPAAFQGDPMQLDAARAKVKAERRAKGLCLYCGSAEHFVSACPLVPKHKPRISQAALASSAFPPLPLQAPQVPQPAPSVVFSLSGAEDPQPKN